MQASLFSYHELNTNNTKTTPNQKPFKNQNFNFNKLCIHRITLYKWKCLSRSQTPTCRPTKRKLIKKLPKVYPPHGSLCGSTINHKETKSHGPPCDFTINHKETKSHGPPCDFTINHKETKSHGPPCDFTINHKETWSHGPQCDSTINHKETWSHGPQCDSTINHK